MPLANNALVLVTDGRKTLFFRNEGDENQIDLRTEDFGEREDAKDRELRTDAPGTTAQSAGYSVNKRVLRNNFDQLVIVAPPKTLGLIRKKLHKEAERKLVCEIPKEMTRRPIPDIEALIVGETKAEAPAAF